MTASKKTGAERPPVSERTAIRKMSLVSIVGNAVLSAFKLFAGIAGHSGAMLSDAVHSLSDVITTFIAYLGVKISKSPRIRRTPTATTASNAPPR